MDLGPDDIGYVCMPLFHSNALMVGWAPSIAVGASVGARPQVQRVELARRRPPVRRDVLQLHRQAAVVSRGDARATRRCDNSLRVAFGNEGSPEVIETFGRRFGVEVIDAFGATEGGIAVNRDEGMKQGSVGKAGDTVKVVDPEGNELPVARFDADGSLVNADECVGEIVNTAGAGPFEGYYNNAEATGVHVAGRVVLVGRSRLRRRRGLPVLRRPHRRLVAGRRRELPGGSDRSRHRSSSPMSCSPLYGVPDEHAGDQVMAAVQLRDGASFDPAAFAASIDSLPEIGPKWRPRYVRVVAEFPTTGTNKIVKRTLVRRSTAATSAATTTSTSATAAPTYRAFTADDEASVRAALEQAGRIRFWDL